MVVYVDVPRLRRLLQERQALVQATSAAARESAACSERYNNHIAAYNRTESPAARAAEHAKAQRAADQRRRASLEHERLHQQVLGKEAEIVDIFAAMLAAAESLFTADTVRRIETALRSMDGRLGRMDDQLREVGPALASLQGLVSRQSELIAAIGPGATDPGPALVELRAALDREGAAVSTLSAVLDGATDKVNSLRREVRHQTDILRVIGGTVAGQASIVGEPSYRAPIVQEGWNPDARVAEPRASDLSADDIAALPHATTVLLFASQPSDQDPVDLGEEIRQILGRIDEARFGSHILLRAWLATQPLDLLPNFNRHKPHMVQFSGHGRADGVLLTGPHGRAEPIAADRLVQMFRWSGDQLRIVFFNVCDSAEHAKATARLVDAAIGMAGKMHDEAARSFAAQLYSGLAFGSSLKHAFHQACALIGDQPDAVIPQIFFREDVDPHRVVLIRPNAAPSDRKNG